MTDEPTAATPVVTERDVTASTPEPVLKAAALWGTLSTVLVTAVGVLVSVGALSTAQGDVVNGVVDFVTTNIVPVGSAIVGIVGLVSGLVAAHATALVARRQVTPVAPARVERRGKAVR